VVSGTPNPTATDRTVTARPNASVADGMTECLDGRTPHVSHHRAEPATDGTHRRHGPIGSHDAIRSTMERTAAMEQLLYTPEEAAEVLKVSRSTVYDLMRERKIPSVKIGRARRIPVHALRRFVDDFAEAVGF
jgi:excisionase family DNA binding protein